LEAWQKVFMDFYGRKYSGRRLVWHHSLGNCVLRAHFPAGTKELSVSLFQAAVLMLFNDADKLSFEVGACVRVCGCGCGCLMTGLA
jgi:cullin-4